MENNEEKKTHTQIPETHYESIKGKWYNIEQTSEIVMNVRTLERSHIHASCLPHIARSVNTMQNGTKGSNVHKS